METVHYILKESTQVINLLLCSIITILPAAIFSSYCLLKFILRIIVVFRNIFILKLLLKVTFAPNCLLFHFCMDITI